MADNQDAITTNPELDQKGGRVGEIEEVQAITPVAEVLDTPEAVEQAQDEVEELKEDIDEVQDVKETIEKVEKVATEALEENNVTPQLGETTHILLSDLFGKAGIAQAELLPSAEMFKNPKTATMAMGIAVESMKAAQARIDKSIGTANKLLAYRQRQIEIAQEAFLGGVGGLFAGFIGSFITGGILASKVKAKEQEIDNLVKEIEQVARDNGEKAVQEGKLSAEDFKSAISVPKEVVWSGIWLGLFFGPVYGAIKGSQLQNKVRELKEKKAELNDLLQGAAKETANQRGGNVSNEAFMSGLGAYFGHTAITIATALTLPIRIVNPLLVAANGTAGALMAQQVAKKRNEIDALSKEIRKIAIDGGKEAVKSGKINAADYKKEVEGLKTEEIPLKVLFGVFLGPIYTGVKTSQLVDAIGELKKKEKELQDILDSVAQKTA